MDRRHHTILRRLREGATLRMAARDAGVSRMTLHRWRQRGGDFASEVEAAYRAGTASREYYCWVRHPRRGKRPPMGKGHGGIPRFRVCGH